MVVVAVTVAANLYQKNTKRRPETWPSFVLFRTIFPKNYKYVLKP